MQSEERIARGSFITTICGSGHSTLLEARLTSALATGTVAGLVSFGISGGLHAALEPGTLVLGRRVVGPDGQWDADAGWLNALGRICRNAISAVVVGSDFPIGSAGAKRELHALSGASIVDTESHIVAQIACRYALPFAVIRTVADSASRDLPPVALVPLKRDGRPDMAGVLVSLASIPTQLPALARVALDARRAYGSLSRIRRDLSIGFACPYLF
ncbi:phosphorylase [Microvirga terricola]